ITLDLITGAMILQVGGTLEVTAEFTVGAWAGNFDGDATQGMVAMRSAAPLVRAGLVLAARGGDLTLPGAPGDVVSGEVCPLSGQRPSAHCPHRKREYFHRERSPAATCDWHRQRHGELVVDYPARARDWAERYQQRGARHL
ncbi:MAG: hypothetical protein AAGC55_27930, partial [Myxococcota bacterium]